MGKENREQTEGYRRRQQKGRAHGGEGHAHCSCQYCQQIQEPPIELKIAAKIG
jgi:hypothetical protein